MRYTLPTHPSPLKTLAMLVKGVFPERQSARRTRSNPLANLAAERCAGFTPLHQRDTSGSSDV